MCHNRSVKKKASIHSNANEIKIKKVNSVPNKKSDTTKIMLNDTLPVADTEYLIIYTKKPQLVFVNGAFFPQSSPWVHDYLDEINRLRDKYCRGEKRKELCGVMEVYARPTFKADISGLIQ